MSSSTTEPQTAPEESLPDSTESLIRSMFPIFLRTMQKGYVIVPRPEMEGYVQQVANSCIDSVLQLYVEMVKVARENAPEGDIETQEKLDMADLVTATLSEGAIPTLKERFSALITENLKEF